MIDWEMVYCQDNESKYWNRKWLKWLSQWACKNNTFALSFVKKAPSKEKITWNWFQNKFFKDLSEFKKEVFKTSQLFSPY